MRGRLPTVFLATVPTGEWLSRQHQRQRQRGVLEMLAKAEVAEAVGLKIYEVRPNLERVGPGLETDRIA